jgi:tRNA G18 (ribose-2'-O)-methylase SpoU
VEIWADWQHPRRLKVNNNQVANSRGYFGVGIYGSKWETNVGTLWRTAHLYGADFIFTIGKRYSKQPSDTPDTAKHTPLFEYKDWADFEAHLPKNCEIVLVEQSITSEPLPTYNHPQRAVYVLGAEDWGLPEEIIGRYQTVEIPTLKPQSMNVSAAGTLVLYDRHTKRIDLLATDSPSQVSSHSDAPKSSPKGKGADTGEGN